MQVKYGSTRTVLLTHRYAFKLPSFVEWRLFLLGLLANMQERRFSATRHPKLCPVLFSVPGGFLVVMKRANPMPFDDFCEIDIEAWADDGEMYIPVEAKWDSFGILDGRVVAVDYGN